MSIVSVTPHHLFYRVQDTKMTAAQMEDFWNQKPSNDELSLHGDVILEWLGRCPQKNDRPAFKDDIMDDLIDMIAELNPRYGGAKSSHKKAKRKRFKSLYDSYDHYAEKFDKE